MNAFIDAAAKALVKAKGETWVLENKNRLCSFAEDRGACVTVSFCFSDKLPSEQEVIDNDFTYPVDSTISFIVDKKSLNCQLVSSS